MIAAASTLWLLWLAAPSGAVDHFVAGDLIRLRDPAGQPAKRRLVFRVAKDPAVVPSLANDPRAVGATLAVAGTAAGDGATGVLHLDAALWTGLGIPSGSRGYRYVDRTASAGVRRVIFRSGPNGGRLAIVGIGPNWPYAVTQAQGPIRLHFTIAGGAATNHADRTADLAPGGGITIDSVVSFGEDARGEIYIADQNGEVFEIVPE
jgi:hypothetical protein